MSRTTGNQRAAIDAVIDELKSWRNCNDIHSPSVFRELDYVPELSDLPDDIGGKIQTGLKVILEGVQKISLCQIRKG